MKLIITTAHDEKFQEIALLSWRSINRYGQRFDIRRTTFPIPRTEKREPSWAKVDIIRRQLRMADCVLWVDADAMIVGEADIRKYLKPTTLNIAKDLNGINCGVMAWWNNAESREALDRMEANYEPHIWFEQWQLMKFVDELKVTYQNKTIFNAYPDDAGPATIIKHWPGMSIEERLPLMRTELAKLP